MKSKMGSVVALACAVCMAAASFSAASMRSSCEKEWTVMVFINADNNLESFGVSDINEMEKVGSSDEVNVIVEMDRHTGFDSSNGDWTGSKRFYIQKDTDTALMTSPVVADLGEADMGDWNHLVDFGAWGVKNYPAKKYMLVVWDHGDGWAKAMKAMGSFHPLGISWDDSSGNHISTVELGKAMEKIAQAAGGRIHVYGSDACLMQMASVAYQLKNSVDVVIGSEELEPGDGWPYTEIVESITSNPYASPEEVASFVVDRYIESYGSGGWYGVTQSAVRTAAFPDLVKFIGEWAEAAQGASPDVLDEARRNSQSFYGSDSRDLFHFIKLVTETTEQEILRQKGENLLTFLEKGVIVRNGHAGDAQEDSYGLAIYLPGWSFSSDYQELAWAQDSQWDEFVVWLLGQQNQETQAKLKNILKFLSFE